MSKFRFITKSLLLLSLMTIYRFSAAQFIGFEITSSSGRTSFPFKKVNNLIVIPVMLNQTLPLQFILDTGVRTTILTDRTISDIINISYDKVVTISGLGQVRELNAYLASNIALSMPGITGLGQSLIVLEEDYLELKNHLGTNVHGIIGYEFFNHFVVKIDYENLMVTVYEPKVFKPNRKFTAVPFTLENGRPYLQISVEQQNGSVIHPKLLVDSGASHGLMFETSSDSGIVMPDTTLQTIIGWGLGGELPGNLGRIKKATIEPFEFHDVLVSYTEGFPDNEFTQQIGRNGSIGGDLLSRFTPVFDYNSGLLYLKKNRSYKQPFEFNMSGIDIVATGMLYNSFEVINVVEASTAYAAGVRTGDEILKINGKPVAELNITEINGILRSKPGSRINLVLKRDGETRKVTFRLKRLI